MDPWIRIPGSRIPTGQAVLIFFFWTSWGKQNETKQNHNKKKQNLVSCEPLSRLCPPFFFVLRRVWLAAGRWWIMKFPFCTFQHIKSPPRFCSSNKNTLPKWSWQIQNRGSSKAQAWESQLSCQLVIWNHGNLRYPPQSYPPQQIRPIKGLLTIGFP